MFSSAFVLLLFVSFLLLFLVVSLTVSSIVVSSDIGVESLLPEKIPTTTQITKTTAIIIEINALLRFFLESFFHPVHHLDYYYQCLKINLN